MAGLLVLGTIAHDTIETPPGRVEDVPGGSAIYSSLAANLLTSATVVGVIGEDFPDTFVESLNRRGINVDGILRVPGKTSVWHGRYTDSMGAAETMLASTEMAGNWEPSLSEAQRQARYVLLGTAHPRAQRRALDQLDGATFVMLDTVDTWIKEEEDVLRDVIKDVDGIAVNDTEARLLTGAGHTVNAALRLLDMGPWLAIVKKGEHGTVAVMRTERLVCPAYPLADLTDPTGAGDAFVGGVVGYMAMVDDVSRRTIRKALKVGTVLSSYTCAAFGTERLAALTAADVEKRLCEFEEMV